MRKIKRIVTESSAQGGYKTILIIFLIFLQFFAFCGLNVYLIDGYKWIFLFSAIFTFIACMHVLSSNINGQAKATWVLFLLLGFGFGYIFYFGAIKRIPLKIQNKQKLVGNEKYEINKIKINNKFLKYQCKYLYKTGMFYTFNNSKCKYVKTGEEFFERVITELKNAEKFIFMEYYIIAEGKLFEDIKAILKEKVQNGKKLQALRN